MRIIGVRRDPSKGGEHVDEVRGPEELIDVLKAAHYAILALPITAQTYRLIGAAELAALGPDGYLINIARGNIVDEAALRDALATSRLAGFASDVWWNYTDSFPATYHFPTPSRTGVHLMDRIVGSGDQAGNADDVLARDLEFGIRSLGEYQRDDPLTLEVDLMRGY
jgi:lactate dehydrogenase-like 2-hydroxyacid dehydrogenase